MEKDKDTVTYQPPTLTELGDYAELTMGFGVVGLYDHPGSAFRHWS